MNEAAKEAPAWPGSWRAESSTSSEPNARCLLAMLHGEPAARWPPPAQGGELLSLIWHHRVHWPLLDAFEKSGAALPDWAAEIRRPLEEQRLRERAAWCLKAAAARTIAEAFSERGVEGLFFKGFALAQQVYASPERRAFGDLDILLRPEAYARGEEALRALGFREVTGRAVFGPFQRSYVKETAPGFELDVDLHWGFIGRESLLREMRVDLEGAWARSLAQRPGMRFPCLEDSVLFGAAQLVRHAFSPLSEYVDLQRLTARPLDWPALWKRAAAGGLRSALAAGLALRSVLLPGGPSDAADAAGRPVLPAWQRFLLPKLLSPGALVSPAWPRRARARYLLKILVQENLWAAAKTCAYLPAGYWKRRRASRPEGG